MSADYDTINAEHYAAYRPPLHQVILEKCLQKKTHNIGLDIGCGTGNSSIALAKFCNRVIGIDPSKSMLERALLHAIVSYQILR
ncbi:methyltransferase domain-containing protein [Aurantibacter sp.]|uniref:methyltransferase domain-containing protein n=1 Tax=Aurantibacter sp. TaxID=2807103 RepID=UPI0032642B66